MTCRNLLIATAIITFTGVSACDGRDTASPTGLSLSVSGAHPGERRTSDRSRDGKPMNVTKECSDYHGMPKEICTIETSNVAALPKGTVIRYTSGASNTGWLDTDIVLTPPGRRGSRHVAFGHCSLSLVTGDGECRITGGTGRFEEFRARVVVSHLEGFYYGWDGSYTMGDRD